MKQQTYNTEVFMLPYKGGRQRVYTTEQRKDRNRLAQAAFRERRSQYTKTLEETVLRFDSLLEEMQRNNACLTEKAAQLQNTCIQLSEKQQGIQEMVQSLALENQQLRQQLATLQSLLLSSCPDSRYESSTAESVSRSVGPVLLDDDWQLDPHLGLPLSTATSGTMLLLGEYIYKYNIHIEL
ncbi:uncharacterized protein BYT42DRAFT_345167 [Radiomyces spectabilis]|uniref:uncharacterized protein n=1 Tax=Radiomyces spectabilis TaxID=64574 RepID=UPI00221F4875|nr:uncharacterized protein BYT42DRAFT_345167 [Radiomyces spectabilis]KAI8377460.1 hypothetical protein BYT42DRAFT_345167 [Radiomyces spectabilis]